MVANPDPDSSSSSPLKRLVASLLPGIFLIGYNVGTGSVTAMSKAGANFGLDLLWAVLVSCVMTFYLICVFSRYTMATGETAIEGFRRHVHPAYALVLLGILSVIIVSALMGVLGIISDVLYVWSGTLLAKGVHQAYWAIVTTAILYCLMWNGDTRVYERTLGVLVAVMGLAFVATMLLHFPSWESIAKGLAPKVPKVAAGSENSPLVIVAGMVGTTVSIFVFVIRTGLVREKGWTAADGAVQRRDALVSASLMFVLSAAIMITASSTLYVQGLKMNAVSEMIPLLEPIAGPRALGLLVLGILAAGLSSHLPNMLVIPWLIQDYRGRDRNTKTPGNRMLLLALCVVSLCGPVFGFRPMFVMLLSQACLSVVLPLGVGAIFYLTSRNDLMGQLRNRWFDYVFLTIIMGFALYMGSLGIKGLITDLLN